MLTDFVGAGEKRSGFSDWLKDVEPAQLTEWLETRKNYKEVTLHFYRLLQLFQRSIVHCVHCSSR
jgi:hypothetical protein